MAADRIISFIPANDVAFQNSLNDAGKKVSDLRIPFGLIAGDWFKSNKQIFTLKGPGEYDDFVGDRVGGKTVYMRFKEKRSDEGSAYPLLLGVNRKVRGNNVKGGRLAKSLLQKRSSESVLEITKDSLTMGTRVPYAIFHQSDRDRLSNLPQRKMIFISGGPNEKADDAQAGGRLARWTRILRSHVDQVLNNEGFSE